MRGKRRILVRFGQYEQYVLITLSLNSGGPWLKSRPGD
jgi:hypothetical protein